MKVELTHRGFERIDFRDLRGTSCSLQQSSVTGLCCCADCVCEQPGASAIWLGANSNRMHISRGQLKALIPHLNSWLTTGSLVSEGEEKRRDQMTELERLKKKCNAAVAAWADAKYAGADDKAAKAAAASAAAAKYGAAYAAYMTELKRQGETNDGTGEAQEGV